MARTTRSSRSGRASTASRRWRRARTTAAAILNLPFTVEAEQLGMRSLGAPWTCSGRTGRRHLRDAGMGARRTDALLERYIAAYVRVAALGARRANRAESDRLLTWTKLQDFSRQGGRAHLRDSLMRSRVRLQRSTPSSTSEGFKNVLALRRGNRAQGGERPAVAPERYVDLGLLRAVRAHAARTDAPTR